MSVEADLYNNWAIFKSLDVDSQEDYYKNLLYSIITESTEMIGSDITFEENKQLFDTGLVTAGKKFVNYQMSIDLKNAYVKALDYSKKGYPLNADILNDLSVVSLRSTFTGAFDLGKYCRCPQKLSDYCEKLNIRCQDFASMQPVDQYYTTFDALLELEKIRPWQAGNHRMGRLVMNYLQYQFKIFPTRILMKDKELYQSALKTAIENNDISIFRTTMLEIHIRSIKKEVAEYMKVMA